MLHPRPVTFHIPISVPYIPFSYKLISEILFRCLFRFCFCLSCEVTDGDFSQPDLLSGFLNFTLQWCFLFYSNLCANLKWINSINKLNISIANMDCVNSASSRNKLELPGGQIGSFCCRFCQIQNSAPGRLTFAQFRTINADNPAYCIFNSGDSK